MANLNETDLWEAGIYQLEEDDPVLGGPTGVDNRAPRQLANRALYQRLRNVTPWDATFTYPANVAYVSYAGTSWKSVGESLNVAPGTDGAKWVRWGFTLAELNASLGDAVGAHEAKLNPHPQYATDADLADHIAAANPHGQYVRHDAAQGLSGIQAAQARTNIGAEAAGTAAAELQKNAVRYAVDTGPANACAVAYAPAIAALVDGMELWFQAGASNTGTATLNVNGIGAKTLVGGAHAPLQGGEIVAGGKCHVVWNAALPAFVLLECTGAASQVAPGAKPAHAVQVAQAAGVIGSVRNLRAAQAAAAATLTFTADEVVVQAALGGSRFCIPGFNKTLNVATVGASGMDTGAAPASGWLACYALANPVTGASHVLGVNATAAVAPEVYGGANMPAGYTHSALIGVWPTTAGGLLAVARQIDRAVHYYNNPYAGAGSGGFTLLSIAGAVPKNATSWRGNLAMSQSTNGFISMAVCPTNGGQATPGYVAAQCYCAAGGTVGGTVPDTPIFTPQTTYFVTAAAGSFVVNSYGYTF
jgi:hypothetical protein